MFDHAVMLFLFAESPLHPGSGSTATAIDLPIQREAHTRLPLNQSSGLKGALRDECCPVSLDDYKRLKDLRRQNETTKPGHADYAKRKELEEKVIPWEIIFGPDTDRAGDHGGCIAPSDARLLLFPVRSVEGVFAWMTCPLALARFARDLSRMNIPGAPLEELTTLVLQPVADEKCLITNQSDVAIAVGTDNVARREVVLEDFCFEAYDSQENDNAQVKRVTALATLAKWVALNCISPEDNYFQGRMEHSIVLVSDTVFRDFTMHSTEVVARNKINDETGVVAGGALWNVENLPSETLLYSIVPAMRPANLDHVLSNWGFEGQDKPKIALTDSASIASQFKKWIDDRVQYMQIGGDQTIGRGFVSVRCLDEINTPNGQNNQDTEDQDGVSSNIGDKQ